MMNTRTNSGAIGAITSNFFRVSRLHNSWQEKQTIRPRQQLTNKMRNPRYGLLNLFNMRSHWQLEQKQWRSFERFEAKAQTLLIGLVEGQ